MRDGLREMRMVDMRCVAGIDLLGGVGGARDNSVSVQWHKEGVVNKSRPGAKGSLC